MDIRAHHYGWNNLDWKDNKLYFQEKLLVELIPHEIYENHYHLKFDWRDEKTPEFFNLTNAKDNSRRIALYRLNYDLWQPTWEPHW